MDPCLSHLCLLQVPACHFVDKPRFSRPTNLYMERPVLPFASDEGLLTTLIAVQVATSTTLRLHRQSVGSRCHQPNEFILIVTCAAAQTRPLRPVPSPCHAWLQFKMRNLRTAFRRCWRHLLRRRCERRQLSLLGPFLGDILLGRFM